MFHNFQEAEVLPVGSQIINRCFKRDSLVKCQLLQLTAG